MSTPFAPPHQPKTSRPCGPDLGFPFSTDPASTFHPDTLLVQDDHRMVDVRHGYFSDSHQTAIRTDRFDMRRSGAHAEGRDIEIPPLPDLSDRYVVHKHGWKFGEQITGRDESLFEAAFVLQFL